MNRLTLAAVLTGGGALWVAAAAVAAQDADTPVHGGVEAGLCVHVGAADGQVEIALARGGRRLVHGLAMDDAGLAKARQAIGAAGLHPLASVERAGDLTTLPYADNLVNLLIADLDVLAAAAPARQEVLRVLAPGGVARLRQGGRWAGLVKPRPDGMDDWTHFDYGPEGNAVSRDRLVRLPTHVQWISAETPIAGEGHPSGRVPRSHGVRLSGGRVFYQWERGPDKRRREVIYGARDAFNGLPLWNVPHEYDSSTKRWQFLAADGLVFGFLKRGQPLVAMAAATGEVLRSYDQGCRLPDAKDSPEAEVRYCDGRLIQTCGRELFVLEAATGKRLWRHEEPEGNLHFPVATAGDGLVFAAVAEKPPFRGRWPHTVLKAIVCLRLADGTPVWRNTEVAGGDIGQLVYDGGSLAVFGSGAISGGDQPFIGNCRAGDGKLLFRNTFKKEYNRFGYNLLVRDGVMYYCDHLRIYATDMASGVEMRAFDDRSYNQRCNRFVATPDFLIYGLVTYVDRAWTGHIQSITRSGCAIGAFPANGMVYFTPNGCGCITGQLRGHLALTGEPPRPPVPDERRLERSPAGLEAGGGAPGRAGAAPPGAGLADVPADWLAPDAGLPLETPPVREGGSAYVAVIHAHRLECRDEAGKVRWAFTAGGRISSSPVVAGGLVLFGSHDGYAYCLRAADGRALWRFLAAPYQRRMVAASQLESSWPVYGVTLHDGLACFSAGRHPELGGGIHVWAVEPATGKLAWKKVLRKPTTVMKSNERVTIVPNRVLNGVLRSEGGKLHLPGVSFEAAEPADAINGRIDSPPISDKKDRRG